MYRIEVATGDETVFRTIEEMATGIRNGLITPRSRIYHAASQKWLAIDVHPHYKKALDLVTGGAPMIDTGVTRPPRRTPAPAPAPAPARAQGPTPSSPPAPHTSRVEPWRPPAPPKPAPVPAPAPTPPPSATLPPAPSTRPAPPAPTAPPASPAPVVQPRSYLPPELFESRDEDHRPAADRPAMAPAATETTKSAHAVAEPHTPAAIAELELPRISYPDVPPPSHAEPHPVARRRPTPRASLLIVGAVAATLAGGYLLRGSTGSDASAEPAPAAAPATAAPAGGEESEYGPEGAFPEESAEPTPGPARAPATPAPHSTAPGTMPLPRPTGPVSQAWSSSAGAIAPISAPAPAAAGAAPLESAPAIAPPPAAMDLSLPKLPSAETIGVAAAARRDSAALKQILRAVSGKAAPSKPAR